jgi:hypothetical protein
VRHGHDRLAQELVVGEAGVQLEEIDLETLEEVQRGIAMAKVVESNL